MLSVQSKLDRQLLFLHRSFYHFDGTFRSHHDSIDCRWIAPGRLQKPQSRPPLEPKDRKQCPSPPLQRSLLDGFAVRFQFLADWQRRRTARDRVSEGFLPGFGLWLFVGGTQGLSVWAGS